MGIRLIRNLIRQSEQKAALALVTRPEGLAARGKQLVRRYVTWNEDQNDRIIQMCRRPSARSQQSPNGLSIPMLRPFSFGRLPGTNGLVAQFWNRVGSPSGT